MSLLLLFAGGGAGAVETPARPPDSYGRGLDIHLLPRRRPDDDEAITMILTLTN